MKVVEVCEQVPALICSKCQIDLTSAAKFKKISLVADSYFQKLLSPHEDDLFIINDDDVNDDEVMEVNENEESVKREEITIEQEEFKTVKTEEYEDDNTVEIEILDEYIDDIIEYDDFEEIAADPAPVEVPADVGYYLIPVDEKVDVNYSSKKRVKNFHECFCGAKFLSSHRLDNHYKVKHTEISEDEKLTCLTCGKKFKIQEYLELHIRNQHTDNPSKHRQRAPCSICGKVLKSAVALKNHEDKHLADSMPANEMKKFSCDLCGLRFRLKSYVFNHMNNVHLRNKYPCEYCGKGFYKKYEKMEHVVRVHTMERPITCEFEGCEKTFARQKNYQIHKVSKIFILIKVNFY